MSDVIVSTTESTTSVSTTDDVTNIAITESVVEVSASSAGVQGASYNPGDPVYVYVTNKTGSTLPKGSIVYTSGANGVHTQVSLALANADATSARTLGWLAQDLANNATGLCMVEGYLDGVNTQGVTEGAQLYLSPTVPGGFTATKPSAPNHMVYVGVCSKASAGNGRVYVKCQNGYELDELHDVAISTPSNNQVLTYESSTGLWKNKDNPADGVTSVVFTAPLTGGTVSSAGTVGLDQSALSITRSQVSDFTSGTVANISGTVAQSQVTNLTTDLAGKANLAGGNTFTGAQVVTVSGTASIPLVVRGTAGQSADLLQIQDSSANNNLSVSSTYGLVGRNAGTVSFALSSQNGLGAFYLQNAAQVGMIVRGASGQSADLLQIQNSGGTVLASIDKDGQLKTLYGIFAGNAVNYGASINALAQSAGSKGVVVRGAASQSASLQEWQNSSGGTVTRITASGSLLFPNSSTSINGDTGNAVIQANSASAVHLVVRGAASQSANLQEWQNSGGTARAFINASGDIQIPAMVATYSATINSGGTAVVPLTVKGIASQSANLQEWQNSGSTVIARVDKNGAVSANYFGPSGAGLLGYLDWTTSSPIFNTGGTGVVGLVVKGASGQSANLTEWQTNAGGTVGVITPTGTFRTAGLVSAGDAVNVLGQLSVTTTAASRIGAVVRGAASQSANLQEWQVDGGTVRAFVNNIGRVGIRTSSLLNGAESLAVATINPTDPGIIVRGVASQSANLQEWQNSSGGTVAFIDPTGFLNINNASLRINTTGASFGARIQTQTDGVGVIGQVIRSTSGQTADLFQFQNSGGTVIAGQNPNAQIYTGGTAPITRSLAAGISISNATGNGTTATITISSGHGLAVGDRVTISGITSVSGNYNGTYVLSGVTATSISYANTSTGAYTGGGTIVVDAQVSVIARSAATTGLVVRGATSQNVNLQEWQNDAGTLLARIVSDGGFSGAYVRGAYVETSSNLSSIREGQSGGMLQIVKATAAQNNPGANIARIYFRDGTNANTLKLVVRAGTAGAETTILDNIPT